MAATINDRDILIMGGTRTQPVVLPPDVGISGSIDPNSEVAGTGVSMTDLLNSMGGDGDYTVEILQNSGTTVTVNSSTLFQMPGPGLGGTFIGGGGIIGRDTAGNTKVTINSNTGLLTAEDAIIHGTLQAGSVLTSSITLTGSGRTLAMIDAGATGYDNTALQNALDTGVGKILAGVGGDYRLNVDPANAFITLQHKDAVYNGTASAGSNKPAVGISAAGIGMGFNRASDGQWVNGIAIESTGEISMLGTLKAGSVIANSVTISGSGTTMQQLVDSMGSTFDLQGALNAGVTNILAGVGSDYRLDVDTANAFVAFRHKDAVYQGTAAAGSNKPALGISAAGLAMGYNQASNGQWVNAVAIESTGEISLLGTLKAGSIITNSVTVDGVSLGTIRSNAATGSSHASATGNVHNVSLTQIGGDLDDISDGSTYFRTTANQRTGGGRAFNALDSSNEYIRTLSTTKLAVVGSNPANGVVMDANGIRMYTSSTLRVNIPATGDPSFSGNITGGANINITGQGSFNGSTSDGGSNYSVVANPSSGARSGVIGKGGGATHFGVVGLNTGTGTAILGNTTGSGVGVDAVAGNNGTGVRIAVGTGGTAINQTNGTATLRNVTIASGGLSVTGASTFNNALTVSGTLGVTGMTKSGTGVVTNLNADMVDGYHASALCNIVGCNTGTCTVSGNGFNMNVTITGFRSRGTGNNVIIEETSDVRLKQDIEPEELGLDFINQLQPKTYRLKSDPSRRYHGFVADDIEQIIGREDDALFRVHPDGMKGSDYISLIAPLVKSIQQLSSKLDALEAQLN